jgi:hypothetical protein
VNGGGVGRVARRAWPSQLRVQTSALIRAWGHVGCAGLQVIVELFDEARRTAVCVCVCVCLCLLLAANLARSLVYALSISSPSVAI